LSEQANIQIRQPTTAWIQQASKVKLTFPKGAPLKDPAGLFNSSLEGNTRRAIRLLQECRTALISAAVTGQIGIRDTTQSL
jgi:hypothetical protein